MTELDVMPGKPAQGLAAEGAGPRPAVDPLDTAQTPFDADTVLDDEPTPFDPPSFDLGAVVRHAEELPQRTTSASGVVAQAEPQRAPGTPVANDQPASMLIRAGDAQMPGDGEVILNYRVLGMFAEGGPSMVYQLSHRNTTEQCLLKVLKADRRDDQVLKARLLAEGRLLKTCSHPRVPRVFEVGTHALYGPFFIMQRLPGGTLGQFLKRERADGRSISVKDAVNLAIKVAETLQAMHQQAAIHRDIKPDNLFIVENADGSIDVFVIDWGGAKTPLSPHSTHVPPFGTLPYMAPEQLSREQPVTGAADQFALNLVLIEMIWQHPYRKPGGDAAEMLGVILNAPLPTLPAHLFPAELATICRKAAQKNAIDRYRSMGEFAEALRAFLQRPWKLAPPPAEQSLPYRATQLTDQARAHGPTLPASSASVPEMPATPPPPVRRVPLEEACPNATLLIVQPAELRGLRFELGVEGTIGRHPAWSNLMLDHPTVSNAHVHYRAVQLDPERPIYCLESLSISNPPFLENDPIEFAPWSPGPVLQLGNVRALLVAAGKIAPDLSSATPLRDIPTPAGAPRKGATVRIARRARRALAMDERCERPSLLVLAPKEMKGLRIELGMHGVIGASEEKADVVVQHPMISGAHLGYTLVTAGARKSERVVYELTDLGSSNGSYVEGEDGKLARLERSYVKSFVPIRLSSEVAVVIAPPGHARTGDGKAWEYLEPEHAPQARAVAATPPRAPRAAARSPRVEREPPKLLERAQAGFADMPPWMKLAFVCCTIAAVVLTGVLLVELYSRGLR